MALEKLPQNNSSPDEKNSSPKKRKKKKSPKKKREFEEDPCESCESIDSSPTRYKNDISWSGYKLKKKRTRRLSNNDYATRNLEF